MVTQMTEREVAANVRSIQATPWALLPGEPRAILLTKAGAGEDVYCYISGGPTTGTLCVWLQPLADVRADRDGRVTLAEWTRDWAALCAEMKAGDRRGEGGAA